MRTSSIILCDKPVGRNISNAQWEELHERLRALDQAGKIIWNGNVSHSVNSYWQGPDTNDDAYYEEYKNESGIRILDYNNNVVYRILRRCANPMGTSDGIPEPRNYTLSPQVDSVTPTNVEANSKVSVTTSVNNPGQRESDSTRWEITRINVQPGASIPHGGSGVVASSTAPCQSGGGAASGNHYSGAGADCSNVASGSGRFNRGSPAQNLKPSVSGIDVGDLPAGAKVCFALSVQPRGSTDGRWAHSQPVCTTVGKKPKVQVWGDDLAVRGRIETSTTVKEIAGSQRTFGSWGEYGVFSVGPNSRFASGAGLINQMNNNQSEWSRLTFANINATGNPTFGNYTTLGGFRPQPAITAYFNSLSNKTPVGSGSVSLDGLTFATGDQVQVRTAGNLTITGGNIPAGRSVVILATGTVTITGNITYTDASLSSLRDIPQVVIMAANINIHDNVGRVDAWLVTNGTINTCSNFTGNLTAEKCNQTLEVNGPVVTNRLLLNRTAGSETGDTSGDPAERFNLRPDAHLWAQLQSAGSNKAQTVYTVELPPRF